MVKVKPRSRKQNARQDNEYRKGGKYAKVNPCQCCGKSSGVDYFSHRLTDIGTWNDQAIQLCEKCAEETDHLETPEEFLAFAAKYQK